MRYALATCLFVLCLVGCADSTGGKGSPVGPNPPGPTTDGKGNWAALKDLAGRYPVVEVNGDATKTGFLTIQADAKSTGFQLEPLRMASNPVTAKTLILPTEDSFLKKQGAQINQTSNYANGSLSIEYEVMDGYIEVRSSECQLHQRKLCRGTQIVVSTGKTPGDMMTASDFFKIFQGKYKVSLVAGATPPPGDDTVLVDQVTDPTMPDIETPFCIGNVCDAGDHFLPFTQTNVFRMQISPARALYWIVSTKPGKPAQFFSWDDNGGVITFRNFQYQINHEPVCLEHVFSYTGPLQ